MKKIITYITYKWNRWSKKSTNRTIFSAALIIAFITFLTKFVVFFREFVVAKEFGTNDVLDSFFIAFMVPTYIINVIAGSFAASFIPTYIDVKKNEGQEESQKLYYSVIKHILILLVGITLLLLLFGSNIVNMLTPKFDNEKINLTISIFFILLPVILVNGLINVWAAVLNSVERFALPAFTPAFTPLVTIGLVFCFYHKLGIYSLAFGTVLGACMEATVLGISLKNNNFALFGKINVKSKHTNAVMKQYYVMMFGTLMMSSTTVVDQIMSASLTSGSVSSLNYGGKFVSLISSIGAIALGTAVLPHFSAMSAEQNWKEIRKTLKFYTSLILLISIPLTIILFFMSDVIVKLLFQRGAFTEADTDLVSSVQAYYLLQVPFYFVGILFVRLLSSLGKNKLLTYISLINILVNITGNYYFMKIMGVKGIALSTSLVYCFSSVLLMLVVYFILKDKGGTVKEKLPL